MRWPSPSITTSSPSTSVVKPVGTATSARSADSPRSSRRTPRKAPRQDGISATQTDRNLEMTALARTGRGKSPLPVRARAVISRFLSVCVAEMPSCRGAFLGVLLDDLGESADLAEVAVPTGFTTDVEGEDVVIDGLGHRIDVVGQALVVPGRALASIHPLGGLKLHLLAVSRKIFVQLIELFAPFGLICRVH